MPAVIAARVRDHQSVGCFRHFLDQFLGVQPNVAAARRAYKRLFQNLHPDRAGTVTFDDPVMERTAKNLYALIDRAKNMLQDADLAARLYPTGDAAREPWWRRVADRGYLKHRT